MIKAYSLETTMKTPANQNSIFKKKKKTFVFGKNCHGTAATD